MKYTLLDIVQTVASSMDSGAVNSINDTEESLQIATVARTAYFDFIARAKLPVHYTEFSLVALGNPSQPVLMTLPSTIKEVTWLKYDVDPGTGPIWSLITPLDQATFINRMHEIDPSEDNILSYTYTQNGDPQSFYCFNDRAPSYYTSLDDQTFVFDAYNAALEATLQSSKTSCYGQKYIPWSMTDTFIPNMEEDQFPVYLNEVKSLAWMELRQMPHQKAEQNARRGWMHLQKSKKAINLMSDFDALPNFGRR